MFFWLLGLKNASRNIGRSVIAIVSMAFATAFITYSISLGRGFPASLHADYRSIIGGEISVYNLQTEPTTRASAGEILHNRLESSPFTDLSLWQPEYFTSGYLIDLHEREFSLAETMINVALEENIQGVYPRFQLPAIRGKAGFDLRNPIGNILNETHLRGRDYHLDALQYQHPSQSIVQGRWFKESDDGQRVCIVPRHPTNMPEGIPTPVIGEIIALHIPHMIKTDDSYRFDYFNHFTVELEVIGVLEMPSRFINWQDDRGQAEMEYIYWLSDEVQVPYATWLEIWELAGGGVYISEQYTLALQDVTLFEDTKANLEQRYIGYSFVSVVDQLEAALKTMKMESRPLKAPPGSYLRYATYESSDIQEDLRIPIGILLSLTAALVVASSLLIMVSERKGEIAVLKAIGAERYQLMTMILGEAFFLTMLGGGLGFAFIWIQNILVRLNTIAFNQLFFSFLGDLLVVMASVISTTLIFGLIPALRMANQAVMDVYRGE